MEARTRYLVSCAAVIATAALTATGVYAIGKDDPADPAPVAASAGVPAQDVATTVLPPAEPAPAAEAAPPAATAAPAPPAPAPAGPSVSDVLGPVLAGGAPRLPQDPATLAAHITVAENVARDPASSPERVSAAGWVAQVAYRELGHRPEWDAAVRKAVAKKYRDDVRRHIDARRQFMDMAPRKLPDTLPAWRIVEPLPADELKALYLAAADRFGVPWEALAAINLVETGMGRIIGFSSAGANGPMQFIPETWARFGLGGNIRDPRDAILAAGNYLRATGAAEGTERELREALFAYNNDVRYVRAVRAYMAILQDDPDAYPGLHAWRIYYPTPAGDIHLPVGYETRRALPVEQYLADLADR